ncbi:MAG: formylglycine-generating enzyme family protein [Dehalococcoidales bacterium]|nr:formylglycine-generating enzyme family protein [Dehalococcoidales bacterium]MDD4230598.1 formylglycine-generating enzyme family protein [Dehalococcoidales bacterium]MDD4465491.1 formylglycine-generating enzyme family protein [Dehalococcoidales bacterium]MDD5402550.1 formylglycine-generating enzyme family protein [Dehalococcoidales bacterium]
MKKLKAALLIFISSVLLAACSAGHATPDVPVFQTGVDPEEWATVPSGAFQMGQFNEQVNISYNYQIMITEVTNRQYAAFLNQAMEDGSITITGDEISGYYQGDDFHAGRHEVEIIPGNYIYYLLDETDSRIVYDGYQFSVKTGYDDHPVTMVSWFGAQAYASYYEWRLPTEAEWEKAARGTDGRPYPWGNGIGPDYANYYNSSDPFEEGTGAIGNTTPAGFYNGKTYGGFDTQDCASPYGVYDMAGNVWEWTADIYTGTHLRYLRGGSKASYGYDLRAWTRNSAHPAFCGPDTGFRVVK